MSDLPKAYIAKDHEAQIYDLWLKHDAFKPGDTGEPFSILMPPPNANESLHVGQALMATVEDCMIRFARMQGKRALWIPGTDHAGFETQVVFEKKLQKEGKSRFDFTPEQLRENIHQYVQENQTTILSQFKMLGASCDWDSLYFTLDDQIVDTAYATFKKLDQDGLLYRGKRLVNYCTKHGTSFSDLEVEYEEQEDQLVYIKYPIEGQNNQYITVATTRPETMLGDTAVAVHPSDKRYLHLVGKQVKLPIIERVIPIVADAMVDPAFGSGAVKVTPAHSKADYDLAKRHNLAMIEVINTQARMFGPVPEAIKDKKIADAREWVMAELRRAGLIDKTEPLTHRVGVCYKCRTPIEPLLLEQWWIKTKPLAEKALEALNKNQITVTPKESKKNLVRWLENIIDWNISRQIVWGIPIPAWFKDDQIKIQEDSPGVGWVKDPDTFDTWFSSTQLPYAALAYPDGDRFKTFFPTSVMETGADILYFWVARMIMMSLYVTGKVPFKHIYLHGLVLDAEGKKMSKSKGNVTDPLQIMQQYGTDALRFGLVHGTSAGQNFNMTMDRVVGGRNLANKLWNASRFVMMQIGEDTIVPSYEFQVPKNEHNKVIYSKLQQIIKEVTRCLSSDQYGLATDLLHDFFWHQFCDVYLEQAKDLLQDEATAQETQALLLLSLTTILKLFHPCMPFVTEALWQHLHDAQLVKEPLLISSSWPTYTD